MAAHEDLHRHSDEHLSVLTWRSRKGLLAGVALLLFMGGGATLLFDDERIGATRSDPAPAFESSSDSTDPTRAVHSDLTLHERRELTQIPLETTAHAPDASHASIPALERFGSLTGSLSNLAGHFLSGRSVSFVRGEDLLRDESVPVITDRNGLFYVERLRPAEWVAFVHGEGRGRDATATRSGSIVILADRLATLHLVMEGTRVVSGALTLVEVPTATLHLELRTKWGAPRVVASGWTDLVTQLGGEQDVPYEGIDPETGQPVATPQPGYFEFSELPSDHYVLRVVLGQNERRENLFVERDVDLSQGDLHLAPEAITLRAADVRAE